MRIIRRKKPSLVPDRKLKLSRSLPVDRYYSGMAHGHNSSVNRNPLQHSDRSRSIRKRQAGAWMHVLLKWFGVVGITVVLLFNVSLNQVGVKIGLNDLKNSDTRYRSEEEYIERAQAAFNSSVLSRSKLTFRADDYEQLIASSLPEVEIAVAVVPLVGTRLQVGLAITEPLAFVSAGSGQGTVVGMNGKLLEVSGNNTISDTYSNTLPMLYIEPSSTLSQGSSILTSSEVELIRLAVNEFDGSSIDRPKMESIRYFIERRELHISFTDKAYYAKLTTERDARSQVGSVLATLRDIAGGEGSPVEYLDVRVDGRVFVK